MFNSNTSRTRFSQTSNYWVQHGLSSLQQSYRTRKSFLSYHSFKYVCFWTHWKYCWCFKSLSLGTKGVSFSLHERLKIYRCNTSKKHIKVSAYFSNMHAAVPTFRKHVCIILSMIYKLIVLSRFRCMTTEHTSVYICWHIVAQKLSRTGLSISSRLKWWSLHSYQVTIRIWKSALLSRKGTKLIQDLPSNR